jgi:teichoic acid transport system permease protein
MAAPTTGGAGDRPRVSLRGLDDVARKPSTLEYLREIWARRELAVEIPRNDVLAQHMDTFLGNVWHVLNPLMLMTVYWVIFGVILQTSRGVDHYIGFLGVGVFVFGYTQRSILHGAASISGNEGLLRSVYFPRAILPVSTVAAETLLFATDVVVMLAVVMLSGAGIHWTIVFFPLVIAVQLLFNLGAAFVVAPINDQYRDFRQVLPYFFRILMYLSGTMYSVAHRYPGSNRIQHVFEANPMYSFISLARGAVMGLPTTKGMYISVAAWTTVLLVGGFVLFRSREHTYGRQ